MNTEANIRRRPAPHPVSTPVRDTAEMRELKGRIAQVYARREGLKNDLETGAIPLRAGFSQLEATDRELSDLDTRFRRLWDAARAESLPTP